MTKNRRNWILRQADPKAVALLQEQLELHPITATVLANRGLIDVDGARLFLNPSLENLHHPLLLPDMEKAVPLLREVIDTKKRILIYGDSDVDGVTGTALLVRALRTMGGMVEWHVPGDEDYGLQIPVLDRFLSSGGGLVVTVDTGTTAHEAVDFVHHRGGQIIVTDHHLPSDTLPMAAAVVNPNRQDSSYPFKGICGCFTALKLAQGLMLSFAKGGMHDPRAMAEPRIQYFVEDHMDLVCLAVLADISPLVSENRIAVAKGLCRLLASRKLGLKMLVEQLGFAASSPLQVKDLTWRLVPLLNAAGRRGQARLAVELLLTDTEYQAKDLVAALRRFNDERRQIQKTHESRFLDLVETQCQVEDDPILVVLAHDLEMGVTGLVATGLVRRFQKPVVLLIANNGQAIGSGRSHGSFDLVAAFDHCQDLLSRYGGHRAAAGLALPLEKVEAFRKRLLDYARTGATREQIPESLAVDAEIAPDQITPILFQELERLAPYGPENPAPYFLLKEAQFDRVSLMGSGQEHLKFWVRKKNRSSLECVGWGRGGDYADLAKAASGDFLVILEKNFWNGRTSLRLNLVEHEIRKIPIPL